MAWHTTKTNHAGYVNGKPRIKRIKKGFILENKAEKEKSSRWSVAVSYVLSVLGVVAVAAFIYFLQGCISDLISIAILRAIK